MRRTALLAVALVLAALLALRIAWVKREHRKVAYTVSEIYSLGVALGQASMNASTYPLPPAPARLAFPSRQAAIAALPGCPPYPRVSAEWTHPFVRPFYTTRAVPLRDGWGNPLLCSVSSDGQHYIIVSLGSDGQRDTSCSFVWPETESWHDIVLIDGSYVSAPSGWTH